MGRLPRLVIRVCSLLLALFLLSSCGSDSSPVATDEEVVKGGVFRQGLVRLNSNDPAKAQTVSERVIASQLYTGLTKWDPIRDQAEPALANRWITSDDQLQWTFHLREQKASNGEVVTAADVKRTLEHIARRNTGTFLAETLHLVKGWGEFTNNSSVSDLAGVVVVDDKTVRIELEAPFSELPSLLANPAFGIVHQSGDGAQHTTGSFVVSARNGDSWVLSKLADSAPHLDQIDVQFFPDARSSFESFKRGELDWTPISPADAVQAGKDFGTSLFKPSLRTVSLSFNLANPKFQDIRFREALVRGVNRAQVAAKLDLHATTLQGVVPSAAVGEQRGGCGSRCFYDRSQAESLIKQAFPNGDVPTITIDVAKGSPFTDPALQQIIDDLAAIGVKATVRNPTTPDQFGSVTVQPDRELFQTSWSGAYPTAGAFIDPLFRSSSSSNVSGLKSQEVDKLIGEAFKTQSREDRVSAYQDAESDAMLQVPVMPIAEFPVDSVQSSRMRGINITPFGTFDIASVWASAPVN